MPLINRDVRMSYVQCPICTFTYAQSNILNHLCKSHANDHVSQEAAGACGLVGCSCSQVACNAASLKCHQGMQRCQPLAATVIQTVEPQVPLPTRPAMQEEQEEAQETEAQDVHEEIAYIPEEHMPTPPWASHIPTPVSRSPSLVSDVEGPTLPDLPPEPPQEEEIEDMPADGMVVLLPLLSTGSQAVPTMLLDMVPEPTSRLPAVPPLTPVPSWEHLLTDTDVDLFSVTISPSALLRIYPPGCYLALCARAPETRDLPMYKDWVLFAELKCRFAFEPRFKLPLVTRLTQAPQMATLLPNPYATAFTFGELRVDVGILAEALQDIGCPSIRMSAFGIKVPVDRFVDPAALEAHTLQHTNLYDIGRTIHTGRVTTLAPKNKKGWYKQYPLGMQAGRGYGGVELKWSGRKDGLSHFKAYSKFTHLLKAGAAGAGKGFQPMSVSIVKSRIETLKAWKERIKKAPARLGQGIRLELTVQARSMTQAKAAAEESRYLDARYLFSTDAGDEQLLSHTFPRQALFDNTEALLSLVEEKCLLRGNSSKSSMLMQRQVVTDLYNALGWNPGRKPTPLDSAGAWWKQSQEATALEQRLEQFRTAAETRTLFSHVHGHLRCHHCYCYGTYNLKSGANTFQVQCTHCKQCLSKQRFRAHLSREAVARCVTVNLNALVADVLELTLAAAPEGVRLQPLSQREELRGLLQSSQYANMEDSLLRCVAILLDREHGEPTVEVLLEDAVEWLRNNPAAVTQHLGMPSVPAATDLLDCLEDHCNTVFTLPEEILLLHGVAGAYGTCFAHLSIVRRHISCQVIPLGSAGPYLGLVTQAGNKYEVLTRVEEE